MLTDTQRPGQARSLCSGVSSKTKKQLHKRRDMRKILLLFIIALSFKANCQNSNYFSIPNYDCEIASDKKFRNSKEVIFVFPNDKDSSTYVEWTKNWKNGLKRFGADCIIKYENELSPQDFNKTMLILGTINSFQSWNRFEIPIKQSAAGFEFTDLNYFELDNSIFYISYSNFNLYILFEKLKIRENKIQKNLERISVPLFIISAVTGLNKS